jgi:hypothetical protein
MWLYNNKFIKENKSWVDANSIRHPNNWATVWSDESKIAAGLVEVADPEEPNGIFYDFSRNDDGTYTSTARDLNRLKSQYTELTKHTAHQLLAHSDWQIIAEFKRERTIDSDIVTYRAAVLTSCEIIEGRINVCNNLEEFKLLFNIPTDPDENPPIHDWPNGN